MQTPATHYPNGSRLDPEDLLSITINATPAPKETVLASLRAQLVATERQIEESGLDSKGACWIAGSDRAYARQSMQAQIRDLEAA